MVAKEFGKVYIQDDGQNRHVEFSVWVQQLSGAKAEGWKTGVALDASASMKDWYGRNLSGKIPDNLMKEYEGKGWVQTRKDDGYPVKSFKKEAYQDAMKRGHVKFTENIVEPFVRDLIAYLANELDSEGKTTAIYWACGDGAAFEVIGDFSPDESKNLKISGPKSVSFGSGTMLTPSMKYFIEKYSDSPQAMYIFITDGKLDDLENVKKYTTQIAKKIEKGELNPVKCILIGVGDKIEEQQMIELDDLETGTDIDIWDHKVAKEMRALSEIMVELVDDILDVTATIYDAAGNVVARFTDGMPSNIIFTMPVSSDFFELEVNDKKIRQSVVEP